MKKKLIAINMNEFNLNFLKIGANKFNYKYIKAFLKLNKIKTFSRDLKQDKNLDPWVQSISMNTGKKSSEHKIYNLGEKIPNKTNQIWDQLSKKNISCAVWGTMNTVFKDNKNIKIFLPDPWNFQKKIKPKELESLYLLPREYAQNYTNFRILKNLTKISKLIFYLLRKLIFIDLIKYFPLFLKIFIKNGNKNYIFFFLFDIISLKIFEKLTSEKKIDFSLIFLNSLAHYQHNNWDEDLSHKDYFYFTNQIFKIIFRLEKNYNSLIIYNGFSQKKIKSEYLIRPKNPKKFFKSIGIKFKSFHSNMTNGAIISFHNNKLCNKSILFLKRFNICGYVFFEIKKINTKQIFIRIKVRSKKNLSSLIISEKKNIKNNFFYEEKNKILKKGINYKINNFIKSVKFIKTTSKHIPHGHLFFRNIKVKNKKLENIKIYNLIYKHYFDKNEK